MKRIFLIIVIASLMITMLIFSKNAMDYAALGLTLWFQNMVPALFPFMVISSLIIRLELIPYIVSLLHPVLKVLFHTNKYCEYAIIMGFLCGYPMGAVIVRDLLSQNKISVKEVDYLLTFCNNIGPAFFCTMVLPIFEKKYHLLLLFCMYGIPLLYGIISRRFYHFETEKDEITDAITSGEEKFAKAFSEAINSAVSSVLFLGGCMIFFNMLRFIPDLLPGQNIITQTILAWFMEVNGAIVHTGALYAAGLTKTVFLLIPFLSIGGLSCIFQTIGILHNTNCNIPKYLMHKCFQCVIWEVFMFLALLLFFS